MEPTNPSTPELEEKGNLYTRALNPMAQQAVKERLSMPGNTVIKRFRSPSQINFIIAGEGMIYFVAGGDFSLKSVVEIDPWR